MGNTSTKENGYLIENDLLSFNKLSAIERWQIISSVELPSDELKRRCRHFLPGAEFNSAENDKTPRVLLIGAYEQTDLPAGRFDAPPFGLQRIASFLKAAGANVEIYPATTLGKSQLEKRLKNNKYDVVGFTILGPTLPYDVELTHLVKKYQPEATLVGGGIVATVRPDLLKEGAFDYIIKGYGEEPLLNLLAKKDNQKLGVISGLYARDPNSGDFIIGAPASIPTHDDLRIYSFLFDPTIGMEVNYVSTDGLYRNYPSERLKTFRLNAQGYCPKQCVFCATRNFLKIASNTEQIPYLSLSAQERFLLVANIVDKLPWVETIFISDDDFFTNLQLAKDFFSKIIEEKETGKLRDIKFIMSARVDEVDEEILALAKRAGVILINFGVESFSPNVLEKLNKRLRLPKDQIREKILENLRLVKEAGLIPSINLMIFVPWASWVDIKMTVEGALEVIKMGGEVNLTTYIRNYYGADITQPSFSESIPFSGHAELLDFITEEVVFSQPTFFLPVDPEMRDFAKRVIVKRAVLEEEYKREYAWSHRRAPHKVIQLCFLQALLVEGEVFFKDRNRELLLVIKKMIDDEFSKLGQFKREKENTPYSTLSLSSQHQEEARFVINKLREIGLEEDFIKIFFDLKTGLFCSFFDDCRFDGLSSFLKYLFFAKERSRFFHLDNLERMILVLGVMGSFESRLNLNWQKIIAIFSAFGIKVDEKAWGEGKRKIEILSRNNLWIGDDLAEETNEEIKTMLVNILSFMDKFSPENVNELLLAA